MPRAACFSFCSIWLQSGPGWRKDKRKRKKGRLAPTGLTESRAEFLAGLCIGC